MTSLWAFDKVSSTPMSEIADSGLFGGLCFEDSGALLRNVCWRENSKWHIPAVLADRSHYAPLIAQATPLGVLAASAGRIAYGSSIGSGWISGAGPTRFFISTSHGFPLDFAVMKGLVSFTAHWDGQKELSDPPTTFEVSWVTMNLDANVIVWKFKDEDIMHLPKPLSFGSKLEVHDKVAAVGYSLIPTEETILDYFNRLPVELKSKAAAPTAAAATSVLFPNCKTTAPGPITKLIADGDYRKLGARASLYHGFFWCSSFYNQFRSGNYWCEWISDWRYW